MNKILLGFGLGFLAFTPEGKKLVKSYLKTTDNLAQSTMNFVKETYNEASKSMTTKEGVTEIKAGESDGEDK